MGALRAGVKVVTGYPGTPTSGLIDFLLKLELDQNRFVEWCTNEKVALEVATGAAWAGQRALCTMKMSGLNVAYDSLISVAYSGCNGGLVIYVADDPGTHAGMCEQDSRGFALMADLPILEPYSVGEAYELVQRAFTLSEQTATPVFVRLVTAIANSRAPVEVESSKPPLERKALLERDITKYTKAGSVICMAQHQDVIARLEKAGRIIQKMCLNKLKLAPKTGGIGVIVVGGVASYLEEGIEIAVRSGCSIDSLSVLRVVTSNPFPTSEVQKLLHHCAAILVLEELEPYIEQGIYIEAQGSGFKGKIIGKIDGTFNRFGEYNAYHVARGICASLNVSIEESDARESYLAEQQAVPRPITVCAGCPHRGTYLAINKAIKRLGMKKEEVMVTGDIGCTILGMNPPFETIWNELSMGASIGLAQGFVYSGVETPVIATMGDSTFFHGGIPGLINAIHHKVSLTLIIMDNGWTSMTGMQANPSTADAFQQPKSQRVDIAKLVAALGVSHLFEIDPFDLVGSTNAIQHALDLPGVKVVVSRQECTIQAMRRGIKAGRVSIVPENCNLCKLCLIHTGCPAIKIGKETIVIDEATCYGCGLCVEVCNRQALIIEGHS